ncbi:hypothetical protein D0C36_10950 [Mucilaginibacter conchicola]|uniref:Uncharacterized protein n=1 Tax=Mucilaginibacter conchicola TaxID=2303333 RepID=A0A372NRT3_9SPHI|nr:hypothetical protein [Mucilaginibacter conchicola]RFZ91958.1 hypothetical protein D0C36_10950 [Mucilaginibacter conchicola]
MENLFSNLLHLFVVFMMVVFVVGGILALTGTFDHWTERYRLKQRRRRLIRNNEKKNAVNTNTSHRQGKPVPDMRNSKTQNTFKSQGYAH